VEGLFLTPPLPLLVMKITVFLRRGIAENREYIQINLSFGILGSLDHGSSMVGLNAAGVGL
jgi:hypothetical protein